MENRFRKLFYISIKELADGKIVKKGRQVVIKIIWDKSLLRRDRQVISSWHSSGILLAFFWHSSGILALCFVRCFCAQSLGTVDSIVERIVDWSREIASL
jgi:hypothetical protein